MGTATDSDLRTRLDMPLLQAILGRRSRRFATGASIPGGHFRYASGKPPMPLSEEEKLLVLLAMCGNTGWHYAHMYNPRYAPHLPNYAAAASGRTFPSGAGFHTVEIFFTDDSGVYFLPTRDAPAVEPGPDGLPDVDALIEALRSRILKLSDKRLDIPPREPYVESHNLWIASAPGSLFVIPVADIAQHTLANLCYYLQNGRVFYDDINNERIPGMERFADMADIENPLPLSFLEIWGFGECVTEISTACYAGALMLQAIGLGGWMYDGVDPFAVLGASGDPEVPGLGFRYDTDQRWPLPNPTGLPGVFEAYCPPRYPNMRSAVDALVERKFGPGGPFSAETPGAWLDSPGVRGSAQVHDERFRECVSLAAQYIYDRFGKFPATVPSTSAFVYLQAHHLDLGFYDRFFRPGAYLRTHAEHMEHWHAGQSLSGTNTSG